MLQIMPGKSNFEDANFGLSNDDHKMTFTIASWRFFAMTASKGYNKWFKQKWLNYFEYIVYS